MLLNPSTVNREDTEYASDDSSSEDGSSSLNANEPSGDNYMSQDESYSGNRNTIDDTEPRTLNDDNDENDVDASYEGSGFDGPSGNDEHVGDLEFDLNIGYDEYQQESMDRH
ncbi:hypothetical protein D1007_46819 [Hordeum vulgare]|nr:hypothetical protein D1007_46819 [Hordeum vulgare]